MEVFEPKCVNSNGNCYGINLLRLGGLQKTLWFEFLVVISTREKYNSVVLEKLSKRLIFFIQLIVKLGIINA